MLYRSQTLCVLSVCVLWACGADGGVSPGAEAELDGGAYEPEPAPPVKVAEPVACVAPKPATPVACTPVACTAVDCTPVDCAPVACTPTEPAPVAPTLPLTVYSVDDPFCRISRTGSAHDGEVWGCRSYPTTVGNVQYPTTDPYDHISCITPTTWPCADGSPAGCVQSVRRHVADVACAVGGQCTVFIGGKGYGGTCDPQTASQVGVRERVVH
jgi:hypothetical protein